MKQILFFLTLALTSMNVVAQKPDHPDHKYFFKDTDEISTDTYNLKCYDCVSFKDFTKFRFEMQNKSDEIIIVNLDTSYFNLNADRRDTYKGKREVVLPHSSKRVTCNATREDGVNYHAENVKYTFSGIETISLDGKVQTIPNYKIPVAQEEFKVGDFTFTVDRTRINAKKSYVTFDVLYEGADYAIFDESKIEILFDGGNKINNDHKPKMEVIKKGEMAHVKVEFPFPTSYAKNKNLTAEIVWNDFLMVNNGEKKDDIIINFEIDPIKTENQ